MAEGGGEDPDGQSGDDSVVAISARTLGGREVSFDTSSQELVIRLRILAV